MRGLALTEACRFQREHYPAVRGQTRATAFPALMAGGRPFDPCLRLGRRVVCRDAGPDGCRLVCDSPAVRFCAEVLAREWEFAASWLEEIESDAHWAE